MWREVSSTSPCPPAVCPARLVPAPRVTTGTSKRAAAATAAATSAASRGKATEQRRARVQARVAREQVARVAVGAHLAAQLPLQLSRKLRRPASPRVSSRKRMMIPTLHGDDASQRTAFPPDPRAHQRPGPRAAGDRRAHDRPSRARLRPPRPRGPRGPARGLQDERAGRRLPRLRHRRVGGGARQHALARRRVLAFETGHFATLWRAMAERLGLEVQWVEGDWRHGADPERDRRDRSRPTATTIRAVMVVHNETSTGVTSRDPGHPRGDRLRRPRRAAARRHHLLARLDRLPPRGVGRRRHRRRLPEGPDAAGRPRASTRSPEGARRRRARAHCRAPTGTGRRSSRPTRPASGPTRRPRTCSTACARRSRCCCARRG